jgi:hypothetical protein
MGHYHSKPAKEEEFVQTDEFLYPAKEDYLLQIRK